MANDLQKIPTTQFFTELVKAHAELGNVVEAVSSGTLQAGAAGGVLTIRLGQFSGSAETSTWVRGVASMVGPSLPPLPKSGTFSITFTPTTCDLSIFDVSGLLVDLWHGVGRESGLTGNFNGSWTRIDYPDSS